MDPFSSSSVIDQTYFLYTNFFFTDYALQFLNKESQDFVQVARGLPDLMQFTLCFWMKSSDTKNKGTPFSYSIKGEDNELLIYNYQSFRLGINGSQE